MSKGQVFIADFAWSVAVFSVFILFFGLAWNSAVTLFESDRDPVKTQSEYTFSILRTEGSPSNWSDENLSSIGLYSDVYLSEEKFLELKQIPQPKQKELLKAQEFKIKAEYLNGTNVRYDGEILSESSAEIPGDESIYVDQGRAILEENRKRVKLKYYTWRS